jgi:hypothetical protein
VSNFSHEPKRHRTSERDPVDDPVTESPPPGGICISAEAWRDARSVVAAEFVDLGEPRLKKIADPAHVFAIAPAG